MIHIFQVRKLQDKVNKCQETVKKCKENYELALLDITNYNSRYQEVSQLKLPYIPWKEEIKFILSILKKFLRKLSIFKHKIDFFVGRFTEFL